MFNRFANAIYTVGCWLDLCVEASLIILDAVLPWTLNALMPGLFPNDSETPYHQRHHPDPSERHYHNGARAE